MDWEKVEVNWTEHKASAKAVFPDFLMPNWIS